MSLHVKGAKDDSGKNRVSLVLGGFAEAILEVCKVGTFGANKYTDNGWQSVPNGIARYEDALFRHFLAYKSGEFLDPESKLPHLAHCAWNALAVLSLNLKERNNGSEDCSTQQGPIGTGTSGLRIGVPPIHPRRADDTSSIQPQRPVFPGSPRSEITYPPSRISDYVRDEQGRYVQRPATQQDSIQTVYGAMGDVGLRGSSVLPGYVQNRTA